MVCASVDNPQALVSVLSTLQTHTPYNSLLIAHARISTVFVQCDITYLFALNPLIIQSDTLTLGKRESWTLSYM